MTRRCYCGEFYGGDALACAKAIAAGTKTPCKCPCHTTSEPSIADVFAATALACEKVWPDAELEKRMCNDAKCIIAVFDSTGGIGTRGPIARAVAGDTANHIHSLLARVRELEALTDKLARQVLEGKP